MAHFDAAFLPFADNGLFKMTILAKLQSYMACGMLVIAVASGECNEKRFCKKKLFEVLAKNIE